jgi:hypothetical protein
MQYLIGERRRQFITELRLKSKIEADVRNKNEKKLQDEIHRRLQQLRDLQEPDTNGIAALEAAQKNLNDTKSQLDAYKTSCPKMLQKSLISGHAMDSWKRIRRSLTTTVSYGQLNRRLLHSMNLLPFLFLRGDGTAKYRATPPFSTCTRNWKIISTL